MTRQMVVRIDSELKRMVTGLAKAEGKNVSDVVRELLQEYVKNRDMGSYVDALWSRIGGKLASRGIKPADIPRMVRRVRAEE